MKLQLSLFFFAEVVGTIAFASSGAMVAIKKQLDLLGVIILGVITAVGGGMLRDILIGNVPPNLFKNPIYTLFAFLTAILLFLVVRFNQNILLGRSIKTYERYMNILDSIGLGVFTISGIEWGIQSGYSQYHFLIIFLGVITGVGGGFLRDIIAGDIPCILKKHIYACASIIGGALYAFLPDSMNHDAAMLIGGGSIFLIRLLATRYGWNLPAATRN